MARRGPHPAVFFLLILPYGVSYGYVGVALVALAGQPALHITPEQIGRLVSSVYYVHGIKFLWAPLIDATLDRKRWYLISLALVVAGTVATTAVPLSVEALPLITAVAVPCQVGLTVMGMACEGLVGLSVADEDKGRASGWYQAGMLVGSGVGGGAALWLAQRVSHGYVVGVTLGLVMLLSATGLLGIASADPPRGALRAAFKALARDFWGILTSRAGLTGLVIALCPVGAGAASAYFPVLRAGWGASEDLVALVTGWLGGVVSALGALSGGWLADRMNRRLSYALAGALTALVSLSMIVAPHAPGWYAATTLLYAFFNGVAYTGLAAFVFETIGRGAVASKYNLFVSLANVAIGYCIRIEGSIHTQHGERGLLLADAGLTVGGILLLIAMWALGRRAAVAAA
jgi:MFS family permease